MKNLAAPILLRKGPRERRTGRNIAIFSALAAPWLGFMAIALRPNPRQMWAQRWPTITFVGFYQIALDRCVELLGLENLPSSGPVILAGNHISKTAMDGMMIGSRILIERGRLSKFVSQTDPADPMLKWFIRLMGNHQGVILPIQNGSTTATMIHFLRHPEEFSRQQPILGIFPAGEADDDFDKQMRRPWHTSAAVASCETGAPIVPFYLEGLPSKWGPFHMIKAVAGEFVGGKPFKFKARLGAPIRPETVVGENRYADLTERVRQAVLELANESKKKFEGQTPNSEPQEFGVCPSNSHPD